jgi:poly-gamma-glutamate capsule biosynthesis protein CapA/YwtB (metallophosphatase superfamily)
MLGNIANNQVPQFNYLGAVMHETRRADIQFGNYEGTLCDQDDAKSRCAANKPFCFNFRGPTRLARDLREAGFNVLSIANNHIFDFGQSCATETKNAIEDEGMAAIGLKSTSKSADSDAMRTIIAKGKRVAFIAFNYKSEGGRIISILDIKRVTNLVVQAKKNHDFVVVSAHAGAEGPGSNRVLYEMEKFMGQPRGDMRVFSKAVIDAGADLVIAHGPHVLRGLEIYKNKLIIHSLGNFANYTMFSLNHPANLGAIIEVGLDDKGDFAEGLIIPTHQYYQRNASGRRNQIKLEIDSSARAINEIRRLSELDFDSRPVIERDGRITPSKNVQTP